MRFRACCQLNVYGSETRVLCLVACTRRTRSLLGLSATAGKGRRGLDALFFAEDYNFDAFVGDTYRVGGAENTLMRMTLVGDRLFKRDDQSHG